MKSGILLSLLVFLLTSTYGQVVYHQYRNVPVEHEAKFIELETQYWSKVAESAIEAGEMTGWALWRKLGVTNLEAPNYMFTNTFENLEKLDQPVNWGKHVDELDYDASIIGTQSISTVTFDYFFQMEDVIPGRYKYALINYADPTDLASFIEENIKLWKPLHEANIHTHTNGMTGWGIASVIYPQGNMNRFTCYTYDGFDKLSDTMNYLRFSSPENEDPTDSSVTSRWEQINAISKMDTIMPDGFQRRIIYELVLSVGQ